MLSLKVGHIGGQGSLPGGITTELASEGRREFAWLMDGKSLRTRSIDRGPGTQKRPSLTMELEAALCCWHVHFGRLGKERGAVEGVLGVSPPKFSGG